MHKMAIDIEETGAIRLLVNNVIVPDLVIEGARSHGSSLSK
jgi:hypothetical protein